MKIKINEKQMLKTLKNLRFFDLAIQYLDTLKVMGILEKQIPDSEKGFEWVSCYISGDTKLKLFVFPKEKTVVGDIDPWIMMDSGDIIEDIRYAENIKQIRKLPNALIVNQRMCIMMTQRLKNKGA